MYAYPPLHFLIDHFDPLTLWYVLYVWASAKMVLTLVFTRAAHSESNILRESWTGALSSTVKCGPSQSFLEIGEKNDIARREISSAERYFNDT